MRNSVRFYITCDDEQPIVRSVPVAVRRESEDWTTPSADATTSRTTTATSQASAPRRVARAVRSVVHRHGDGR
jgi:hypothetical protein